MNNKKYLPLLTTLKNAVHKLWKNPLSKTFLLSLIFHFLFFFAQYRSLWQKFFADYSSERMAVKPQKLIPVPLAGLNDGEQTQKILQRMKEKIKKRNQQERSRTQQIVNNEQQGKDEAPTHSRFLGEKNQKYDRQTVAQRVGTFNQAGLGVADGGEKKASNQAKEKKTNQKSLPNPAADLNLADLGVGKMNLPSLTKKTIPQPSPSQGESPANGNKANESLVNNQEVLGSKNGQAQSFGLSQNNDYIDDVPLGEMTNLNTKEFKYFGFYARIRKRLEQFWGVSLKEKADKLGRSGKTLSSNENYITSLRITLDHKGNITKVVIVNTSGIKDLDEAAIESFNKAGPFPNPPQGMIQNGEATIEWGFVVKS